MKQLLQNMRDGKAEVVDVPIPVVKPGFVLVHNRASVVSAGTERMVVSFAEKSLLGKARSRPDLVKQVVNKARREGLINSISAAFNRLDQPMALGYSSAGVVLEVGEGIQDLQPGMNVACAGSGFATHAEYVLIPKNLVVPFQEPLTYEEAAFATLAAISLQGFRLANPQIGERVAIIGMGLLGLILAQIAQAAGCQVTGIDVDVSRVELANQLGIPTLERAVAESQSLAITGGRGFDTVFICADTPSSDPVQLAGHLARDRAAIVSVGATGLNLPRKVYYEKELQFHVSRSYGPGRYDIEYEENGRDYPFGYVRWTEGRNLEAVIHLMEKGQINLKPLITHRFEIADGVQAYETITGKRQAPFLGVVIQYPYNETKGEAALHTGVRVNSADFAPESKLRVGVLGAGLYAGAVFLPILSQDKESSKVAIASARGITARHAAKKFGFEYACTAENDIIENKDVNIVVVLTRHNDHPRQVIAALKQQKHVYCEKPLAINEESLKQIAAVVQDSSTHLMVGFNRRFAPMVSQLKQFLKDSPEPLSMHYRVNAGFLPLTHWLHDADIGGGRIIGEACHFIDLLMFLAESPPVEISSFSLPNLGKYSSDNVSMTIRFLNGSIGTIEYLANGNKSVSKEYLEVFRAGKVAILDDFRSLRLVSEQKSSMIRSRIHQDKGHTMAWKAFSESILHGTPTPISFADSWNVTQASFAAVESIQQQKPVSISIIK